MTFENKPQKAVLIYLVLGITWISITDYLIRGIPIPLNIPHYVFQTFIDIFFFLITAVILFLVIKKQGRLMAQSERQYKNLFYSNPNPIWIYDSDTLQIVEVNNVAIINYGYTREEFKHLTILDIRHQEDCASAKKSAKAIPNNYSISEQRKHRKKNGKIIQVNITSHQIVFNGRDCIMVMSQDITIRLKQEEQIKEAFIVQKNLKEKLTQSLNVTKESLEEKQKLAEVVERINNMVMITDTFGKVTWVNNAFTQFTGYPLDEIASKTTEFLHGPRTDRDIQVHVTESIKNNTFKSFEMLNYTKAGQEYWVEFNISPIYNHKNKILRYISIQSIITERKLKEARIKKQNQTLRNLAWKNSHILRKPIASVLALVSLSKEMQNVEEIKEIHRLIEVCFDELDTIVKEINKDINTVENEDF